MSSETPPEERFAIPFVKAIVLAPERDGFLVQRRVKPRDPYYGFWELPGGKMRLGETAEAALRREVEEEAGLRLREVLGQSGDKLTDRFGRSARVLVPLITVEVVTGPWPFLGLYFVCLADGTASRTAEGGEHRYVSLEEFRSEFLAPDAEGDCTTLDLLAMRNIMKESRLDPFLRVRS